LKNNADRTGETVSARASSCYICARAGSFERLYISNIIYLWKKDTAFRKKFASREFFCLPHYGALLTEARSDLSAAAYEEFLSESSLIQKKYLEGISSGISAFCKSFDYKSTGPLSDKERNSIERAIEFLG